MNKRYLKCTIWECLPEIIRLKLRALAPAGWCPPGEQSAYSNLEDTEEIDRLIRQTPKGVRRQATW
jgi:hypothetical protein